MNADAPLLEIEDLCVPTFLRIVLHTVSSCWSLFYVLVENILVVHQIYL